MEVLPRLFPKSTSNDKIINKDNNHRHGNKYNNIGDERYHDYDRHTQIKREDDNGNKMVSSSVVAHHGSYDDEQEDWLVEMFLWHIRAFGFVEVTSGLDRGSFCHEVRRKRMAYYCVEYLLNSANQSLTT